MKQADSLRASASAVIFDSKGKVLLHRRSDNRRWGIPGGGIEIGESVEQAVVREVREETGLEVTPLRLIGVYSDPELQVLAYPDGTRVQYVNLCFECKALAGELTPGDESLEFCYADPRDLPADLLEMHRPRIADALVPGGKVQVR